MMYFLFLQECAGIFETLQRDYYEEYKVMGLADLAVAVVYPLLKDKLRTWDPLKVRPFTLVLSSAWLACALNHRARFVL